MLKAAMFHRLRRPHVIGCIDGLRGSALCGWAADPHELDVLLDIEVTADGRTIAEGRADQFRSDLLEVGYGHGRHGFTIDLPALANPGGSIAVRAFRPGRAGRRQVLPLSAAIRADILRQQHARSPSVAVPEEIARLCKQVASGTFTIGDGPASDAQRLFLSEELLAKTLLAATAST